jgi:hypothetical protein
MFKYFLNFESYHSDGHIQNVIFIFFVHEKIEYFIDQGNFNISEYGSIYFAKTVSSSCVTIIEIGTS